MRRVADVARMLRGEHTTTRQAAHDAVSRLLSNAGDDAASWYLVGGLSPQPLTGDDEWIKRAGDWACLSASSPWRELGAGAGSVHGDIEWGLMGLATCLWHWASQVESIDDLDRCEGASIAVHELIAAAVVRPQLARGEALNDADGGSQQLAHAAHPGGPVALPPNEDLLVELEKLERSGMRKTAATLAEKYGCSRSTIQRRADQAKAKRKSVASIDKVAASLRQ